MSLRAAAWVPFVALLSGSACDVLEPTKSSAVIAITVNPNPVVIRVACLASIPPPEFCLASLDPTITVAETGGVGGRIELIELVVRNTATNTEEGRVALDSEWLRTEAGTDRIEARGSLAFQPVIADYPVENGTVPALVFTITVRFLDDNGHTIDQSLQVGGA
ncbi:MAG TPA: hypothetical protein VMT87_07935 [Vicinamibacteria bacterium]|nr:hypothetical protein [Vicinamibacteria bacterium]